MSSDDGARWNSRSSGLPLFSGQPVFVNAFAVIEKKIFAGTDSGIFISSDFGANWLKSASGLTNNNVGLLESHGTILFAGSAGIFTSSDNGSSWVVSDTDISAHTALTGFATNGSNVFASAWDGVYRTSDEGSTWIKTSNGLPDSTEILSITSNGGISLAAQFMETFFFRRITATIGIK